MYLSIENMFLNYKHLVSKMAHDGENLFIIFSVFTSHVTKTKIVTTR